MKKNILALIIGLSLVMTMLAGCGSETVSPTPTAPEASSDVTMSPAPSTVNANDTAELAYMNFLNGKSTVTTSEVFREDDENGNYDGLVYGEYDYSELKAAIAALESYPATTRYAFVDLGHDGVNELALRFENTEPSLLNWVGILSFNGESLELNYYYEDGYRTFSELYDSGYLLTGGSMSAGASISTVVGFDGNGSGSDIFSEMDYYGTFATVIVYDLGADALSDNYDDIAGQSMIYVREYLSEGSVKISVADWSADAAVRAREEALVEELVSLGAERITEADMDALCSLTPYESEQVEWLLWDDGSSAPESADAVVSIGYADEGLPENADDYYEFIADDSEYQVKAVIYTDAAIQDLRVLSLSPEDAGDTEGIIYSASELYCLPTLTPEKPLVVGMVFVGDIPNMGLSYLDASGVERSYAIAMSGEDGSLLLVESDIRFD